jgi:hypothetical protein
LSKVNKVSISERKEEKGIKSIDRSKGQKVWYKKGLWEERRSWPIHRPVNVKRVKGR